MSYHVPLADEANKAIGLGLLRAKEWIEESELRKSLTVVFGTGVVGVLFALGPLKGDAPAKYTCYGEQVSYPNDLTINTAVKNDVEFLDGSIIHDPVAISQIAQAVMLDQSEYIKSSNHVLHVHPEYAPETEVIVATDSNGVFVPKSCEQTNLSPF